MYKVNKNRTQLPTNQAEDIYTTSSVTVYFNDNLMSMDFISDHNYSHVLHPGKGSSDSWQSVLLIDHSEWETMKLSL